MIARILALMLALSFAAGEDPVLYSTDRYPLPATVGADGVTRPAWITTDGKTLVGNVREKFKDGFVAKDATTWTFSDAASDLVFADGNVAGSSYIVMSKSVTTAGVSAFTSKQTFKVPSMAMAGLGLSSRVFGQEFRFMWVAVDDNGNPIQNAMPAPVTVSTIDANNADWVVTTATPHGLLPGDWFVMTGNSDSRANVGPAIVKTITSQTVFTYTGTDHNANLTATGSLQQLCPCGAQYGMVTRFYGATAGNADAISRNGATRPRVVAWNPGNTQDASAIPNEIINYASIPYVRAFRPKGEWNMVHTTEDSLWVTKDQDVTTDPRSASYRRSEVPDQTLNYALRFEAINYGNLSRPIGNILTATKAGSTTATLDLDRPHGLNAASYIVIYGCRDATNFANLTTATVPASIVDSDTITIAFGASYTGSTYGGTVFLVEGGQAPVVENENIQSFLRTSENRLEVTCLTAWGETIGNTVTVFGLVNSSNAVETAMTGRYRVANRVDATFKLELEPLDGQDISGVPLTATNAGGTLVRNTDFRIHYAKVLDYYRQIVEAQHAGIEAKSVPVNVNGTVTVSASNLQTNIAQLNGGTVATGNGTSSTNTMRVALVSDNTAVSTTGLFSVKVDQTTNGTTNAVAAQGVDAASAATSKNPVPTGGRVFTAPDTSLVANDAGWHTLTTGGALLTTPYGMPEQSWTYAAAGSGIVNTTTAVTIKAAAGAGLRNYLTDLDIMAETLTNATELAIRDGAAGTVIWRTKIPTTGMPQGRHITFNVPLKSTAATLLEVVTLTASGAGAVYVNANGFVAP